MKLTFLIALFFIFTIVKGGEVYKGKALEVTESTYDNFAEELTKANDYILFFYSNNCGHCVGMYSEVDKLSKMMDEYNVKAASSGKKEVKLAVINGQNNQKLVRQTGVEYYPSIIYYHSGIVQHYPRNDNRTAEGMFNFYTTDYYKVLPQIPGVKRDTLTFLAISNFYTKLFAEYQKYPYVFQAAGAILALGLLLHPICLYRKNPFNKKEQ